MHHVNITVTQSHATAIRVTLELVSTRLGAYTRNTMASATKHPLFGFMPRKVTANQVQEAIVRVFSD